MRANSESGYRLQMSSGLGATAMGIGVSHGTGGEGIAGGCRLRAQNQSQTTGSAMQHSNPQSSSQQQQQQSQQQQQQASASQQQSQQQRQTAGLIGRSKKDNCCLCWCCCCSCSWYYRSCPLASRTSMRSIPRKNACSRRNPEDSSCSQTYTLFLLQDWSYDYSTLKFINMYTRIKKCSPNPPIYLTWNRCHSLFLL